MRVVQEQPYGVRTMGISRVELLKELLPNMNRLFENLKIDQIIHNEAAKQKELEDAV